MKMLDLLSEHNLAKQDVKGLSPKNALKISWLKFFFGIVNQNFEYRNVSLSWFGKYTLLIIVIHNNKSVTIFFNSKASWDIKYFPSLDSFFVDLDEKKLLIFYVWRRSAKSIQLAVLLFSITHWHKNYILVCQTAG